MDSSLYPSSFQNKPKLQDHRQALRWFPTKFEYVLWQELRRKKTGYRFRRQFEIGAYIVDFYCHRFHLVIEIDGPIHADQQDYDAYREAWIKRHGFTVLRFTTEEVLFHRDIVMDTILSHCRG